MSRFAVVVVRWRGGNEVSRCLQSVFDLGGPQLSRVVLVDSASGDGGAERLARDFPDLQTINLDVNLGFAHAANRGAAVCNEPLLLLLNPDTELQPGAAPALLDTLDHRPRCAGAVPALEHPHGGSQHRWQLRRLPSAVRLATGLAGRPAFSRPPRRPRLVEQPAAAAWMIRRRIWSDLGGLDPVFRPAWWEDVDFCRRLAHLVRDPATDVDQAFVVVPQARVRHHGGSSVATLGREAFLGAYVTNLLRYTARHHPRARPAVGWGLRFALLLRMTVRPARFGEYRAALRAVKTATPGAPAPPPPAAGVR